MRSMFTLKEVGKMMNMSEDQVQKEIDSGHLGYTFENGEKKVTLYDLEKYMGADQTRKITREFLQNQS